MQSKITHNQDFLSVLQNEFVSRCKNNGRYSLRAFARSLNINPSPLSAILRGKRPITKKTQERLGLALGLTLDEIAKFQPSQNKQSNFQQITMDQYAIISDWYHYAILELTHLKSFKPDNAYVAKTLGISLSEVTIAVQRLERVGMLKITKNECWIDTSENGHATNINGNLTSHAARKLQHQILQLSMQALEEIPIEYRSHTSMTMAINKADIPKAKEYIQEFRRNMCKLFEKNNTPDEVYNLSVSLYPITKTVLQNKKKEAL